MNQSIQAIVFEGAHGDRSCLGFLQGLGHDLGMKAGYRGQNSFSGGNRR